MPELSSERFDSVTQIAKVILKRQAKAIVCILKIWIFEFFIGSGQRFLSERFDSVTRLPSKMKHASLAMYACNDGASPEAKSQNLNF